MLDVAVALLTLAILSPLLALVALAIRLDSPGPIIIAQDARGARWPRLPLLQVPLDVRGAERRHAEMQARYVDGP